MCTTGAVGDCMLRDHSERQSHPWPALSLCVIVCGRCGSGGMVGSTKICGNAVWRGSLAAAGTSVVTASSLTLIMVAWIWSLKTRAASNSLCPGAGVNRAPLGAMVSAVTALESPKVDPMHIGSALVASLFSLRVRLNYYISDLWCMGSMQQGNIRMVKAGRSSPSFAFASRRTAVDGWLLGIVGCACCKHTLRGRANSMWMHVGFNRACLGCGSTVGEGNIVVSQPTWRGA